MEKYKPGTQEAVDEGCTCPWEQGQAFQDQYWHNEMCPYHGNGREAEIENTEDLDRPGQTYENAFKDFDGPFEE